MIWKWKNALTDGLPKDKQQVVISVDGINYIAEYSGPGNLFTVQLEIPEKIFSTRKDTVYWIEFLPPKI